MGKFRSRFSAVVSSAVASRKTNKKQLALSIISLILAAVVLTTGTYCWFALSKSKGEGKNINLVVGNGLRVNDLGEASQKFNDKSYLQPASSVDGRNLFFPTDGTDFSKETALMTFRSANAGDRNYNYVQLDFNLTAEANYTSIYLDKSTSLKIEVPEQSAFASLEDYEAYKTKAEKAEKALRMAIYYDGMEKPVVFTSQMNPWPLNAVKDIDRTTGRFLESANQVAYPFKDYTYGKNQLAVLNQGETRPFSLIIWLEGTDTENCISDAVMLKQLVLNLTFTTSWDNTEEIIFVDDTRDQNNNKQYLVRNLLNDNPAYSLVLDYDDPVHNVNHMRFTMQKFVSSLDNYQWKCDLPGIAHNNISFLVLNGSGEVVEEWSKTTGGASTLNRGTATTYFADSLEHTDSCGHWYDGDIEQHGEGHDSGIPDDDDW